MNRATDANKESRREKGREGESKKRGDLHRLDYTVCTARAIRHVRTGRPTAFPEEKKKKKPRLARRVLDSEQRGAFLLHGWTVDGDMSCGHVGLFACMRAVNAPTFAQETDTL